MFVMMFVVWPALGGQNVDIESWRVTEAEFAALTQAFIEEHGTGETIGGVPVVAPPPGDVYLMASRFQFRPVLQLKKDEKYRFIMSSTDVQHGFSLQPDNFNFQLLPGYVSAIELTPEKTGEYQIVCNEYCGLGHQVMLGKVIVVD